MVCIFYPLDHNAVGIHILSNGTYNMGYKDDLSADPEDPEPIPDNEEYNETHK